MENKDSSLHITNYTAIQPRAWYLEHPTTTTILSQQLENAMDLWKQRAVTVYSMTLQIVAFGEEKLNRPNLIRVDQNDNIYYTDAFFPETVAAEIQTVDALFTKIYFAIVVQEPRMAVDYDGDYGYPTSIFINSAFLSTPCSALPSTTRTSIMPTFPILCRFVILRNKTL